MARVRRGTESLARWRVRSAFCGQPPLTRKQLLARLGGNDAPAAIAYHVRKLVQAGILVVKRDGSQVRYTLKRIRKRKRGIS